MKLPRFKLRTLFVLIALISIPMGWVMYQLNWIRQRHAYIDRYGLPNRIYGICPMYAPWPLNLFGERPITAVNASEETVTLAQQLFPEVDSMNFWGPSPEGGTAFAIGSRVRLKTNRFAVASLKPGAIGVIAEVFAEGNYHVEFSNSKGYFIVATPGEIEDCER